MRIVFMGTPEFACPVLAEIIGQGHQVSAVYTRAAKPSGRGMAERVSAVHALAKRFHIEVLTPNSLHTDQAAGIFRGHQADVAVVVAYGLILPEAILDAPRFGCLNLHGSLLPRWRGAAPVQRAIMAGDKETGVTIMRMDQGLDTGPIAMAERVAIAPEMTASELHDRLARVGTDLMARALAGLASGRLQFQPQAETGILYAKKIEKSECRIDWTRPSPEVHDRIRGLSRFPGAYFETDLGRGQERVKVLRSQLVEGSGPPGAVLDHELTVACGEGAVRLTEVQRAGKAPMPAAAFLRGASVEAADRLG